MKSFIDVVKFFCLALACTSATVALADIDGKPVVTATSCDGDAFSAAGAICDLFKSFGGADLCQVTTNTCAKGSQEIFVGNQIELASPTNIKAWSGFGGMGAGYQAANLCVLRDLKDGALTSQAVAGTFLGNVSIKQRVQFFSFDRTKLEWVGYHRGQACAPAIGCIDIFTQKITAKAVANNLQGSGKKAGEYNVLSAHALDISADGVNQALKVTIPAIEVKTPYGAISAKPEFGMGRAMGFVLSPYQNGNAKSMLAGPWGNAKTEDIYGRNPGTSRTGVQPNFAAYGSGYVDNRVLGYVSQLAFGSRSADPKAVVWTPAAGVEFPVRPDSDLDQARSTLEKIPNAYLGANVKVAYSPTDLLPAAIRSNSFITIAFDVFAQPKLDTAFTSQFNLLNYEVAKANRLISPAGPVDPRPQFMEQYKGFSVFGGSSAAARFALDAGVNLTLHLHVPLPWPLSDIDLDLVDIHPKTTIAESITTAKGVGDRSATVTSQASAILASGEWFQQYKSLKGPVASGKAELQQCLAAPSVSQPPPPAPSYTPGSPQDLTKGIKYPCNICVAMQDYTYEDEKKQKHTIKGFIQSMFPADQSVKPVAQRWTCDQYIESGCYDMCSYDPNTNKLTVVETALEMIAAKETKNMPLRCR